MLLPRFSYLLCVGPEPRCTDDFPFAAQAYFVILQTSYSHQMRDALADFKQYVPDIEYPKNSESTDPFYLF